MKKEIKKEIDVDMDKDMQEIIEKNYMESRKKYLQALKKQKAKERILSIIIGVFIVITTILLIVFNYRLTEDAKKSCMSLGHSENYCISKL